jgi:hypothetical protein
MLAARDAGLLSLTLWLWTVPPASVAMAVSAALATVLIAYLVHEWGHLTGCLSAGARFELPAHPFASPFLFKFDRTSSRPQFFAMAAGGFAASILTIAVLLWLLPRHVLAGQIALALSGLGVAAVFVIELPEFLRVWRGAPLPDGAAFVNGKPAS